MKFRAQAKYEVGKEYLTIYNRFGYQHAANGEKATPALIMKILKKRKYKKWGWEYYSQPMNPINLQGNYWIGEKFFVDKVSNS